MTPSLGTFPRGLVAAAAALALALPAGSAAAAGEADDPHYQQPTVGECRSYTYAGMTKTSEPSAPVDCTDEHTALVVAVGTVPEGGSMGAASPDVQRVLAKTCYPALWETLDRTHKVVSRSAYQLAYYLPTKAQRAQGARWVRCDLVRLGGARLLPLAAEEDMLSGKRVRDHESRCLVKVDGSLRITACERRHSYRSAQALIMPFERQPSERKAVAFAQEHCRVAQRSNRWLATWAVGANWKAGNRTLVCFARTSE